MRGCARTRRRAHTHTRLCVIVCVGLRVAMAACPNDCNHNGVCTQPEGMTGGVCECYDTHTGPDCRHRRCPAARSWVSFPPLTDAVHTQVRECAGVGVCDRATGTCECNPPYGGAACEVMPCPGGPTCSGHGLCVNLRQAGALYDGYRLTSPPVSYALWDAERIFGCVCDAGFAGVDCSVRQCLAGDDPLTTGQSPSVQKLVCACPAGCSGSFIITLFGRSRRVLHNAVARIGDETGAPGSGAGKGESLESALRALREGDVISSVSFASPGFGICTPGGNEATITFKRSMGAAARILVSRGSLTSSSGSVALGTELVAAGTTEAAQCSNRGTCTVDGDCACYRGFGPSDGDGGAGNTLNCGAIVNSTLASVCPGITASGGTACNGHGVCSGSPSYTCACYEGYTGIACEKRTCPVGRAWWDEPTAPDTAHGFVECSGRGTCTSSGTCACAPGYTGAACDRTVCPMKDGETCGGRGQCYSLRELARLGSWGGAPKGNTEVQEIHCTATAGTFSLSFRYAVTVPIAYDADAEDLRAALEALPTLGIVELSPATGPVCATAPGLTTRVTFLSDFGNLPELTADTGQVLISTVRQGSRVSYGDDPASLTTWDADMIYGCSCDGYPDYNHTSAENGDIGTWYGAACDMRVCPVGIDPHLACPAAPLRREVQTLVCNAVSGGFALRFRGVETAGISHLDTATVLKDRLEALPSIERIEVTTSSPPGGGVCGVGAGVSTQITFLSEVGNVPLLEVVDIDMAGGTATVSETTAGTGTPQECSGRGTCNPDTGLCMCFPGYVSSDGIGGRGPRGDCGAVAAVGYLNLTP